MKMIFVIIGAILGFSSSGQAHKKEILEVRAKDFSCHELQDLVAQEGHIFIKGFGQLDVFKNKKSCKEHFGYRTKNAKVHFPTNNKTFCYVGYRCILDFGD